MKKTLITFLCALYIVLNALFSFPAVSWFDRWSIGIAGVVIALFAFNELRAMRAKEPSHDERPKV